MLLALGVGPLPVCAGDQVGTSSGGRVAVVAEAGAAGPDAVGSDAAGSVGAEPTAPPEAVRSSDAAATENARPDGTPVSDILVLDGQSGRDLSVRLFTPQSRLRVHRTEIKAAKFPVVDVHNHFFHKMRHNTEALRDFIQVMDRNQIRVCVSLDGRLGDQLDSHIEFLYREHRDRFVIFANVDWQGDGAADDPASWACQRPEFGRHTARQLADAVGRGVSGLKVFKQLGLGYRDAGGELLKIDDPRWDPIWSACGELGIPVLIHSGDPAAFFDPIDRVNERWEELSRNPSWSFHGDQFPALDELMEARNRVIARHPKTQFIGAHMASSEHDLETAARWLDAYPNLHLDIASRISELGRQPRAAREFFIRYADRILFATDGPWPETRLHAYWRFLETGDEAFDYSEKSPPPQGLWRISGVELPDDVLRKIYHLNAVKLIPGVGQRLAGKE